MPAPVQRIAAIVLLILLSPALAVLAAAVRLTSPGPALHRAIRAGPSGTFVLYKLRTMAAGAAAAGLGITAAGDARITRLGRFLRRTKLDELPQLWNVARGDMLLVGPRPEDPRYVDLANPLHARVFGARPGITGAASLAYRNEEVVLAEAAKDLARAAGRERASPDDVDRAYREIIQPAKLQIEAAYLDDRSTRTDLLLIARTIGQVLRRTKGP